MGEVVLLFTILGSMYPSESACKECWIKCISRTNNEKPENVKRRVKD